jgi:hypothetical protein
LVEVAPDVQPKHIAWVVSGTAGGRGADVPDFRGWWKAALHGGKMDVRRLGPFARN